MEAQARTATEAGPDPEEATGESIGDLIRRGDHRTALTRCALDFGSSLGRSCMAWLGSQAEAEEVVQETLLAAHDGLGSWRGEGTVRAWLFGIARRKCAKRLEKRTRRDDRRHLVPDADPANEPPDDAVERRQRAYLLRDVLARLRPSERDVLVLRYGAGLTYREIAQATGTGEVAARKRASRGLLRLRELLNEEVAP